MLLLKKTPLDAFSDVLHRYAFPNSQERTFAFAYKELTGKTIDGYCIYDIVSEFQRQNLILNGPQAKWLISDINNNFSFCPTYPSKLILPIYSTLPELDKVAEYRSKRRIPTLTYFHSKTNACLLRCSQPLCGIRRKRSTEDERLLFSIIGVKEIYDCRPKVNAVANQAAGGGYENLDSYSDISLTFMNIENIHVVRESLLRLQDLCLLASACRGDGRDEWLSELDTVGWLHHIRSIIMSTNSLVRGIEQGKSVLCHCSDGWDRTSQVCALAQILLDPYFRTIRGFEVLIEKEWISFGHKFAERYGHSEYELGPQRSPIFLQFLDCVSQLIHQFPTYFEFDDNFLYTIAEHATSCRFGTFLFNCERERHKLQVRNHTVSLWSWINSSISTYSSPIYNPNNSFAVLHPNADLRFIRLWPYYHRWDYYAQVSSPLKSQIIELMKKNKFLEEQLSNQNKNVNQSNTSKTKSSISIPQLPISRSGTFSDPVSSPKTNTNTAPSKPIVPIISSISKNAFQKIMPTKPVSPKRDNNSVPNISSTSSTVQPSSPRIPRTPSPRSPRPIQGK